MAITQKNMMVQSIDLSIRPGYKYRFVKSKKEEVFLLKSITIDKYYFQAIDLGHKGVIPRLISS